MIPTIKFSSPLHEKRLIMLLMKKQFFGRRAYSDITTVKLTNKQVGLYEEKHQNTQEEEIPYDRNSNSSSSTENSPRQ
jgi:hypothetical protein